MGEYIYQIKGEGNTIGGVISCVIKGCPVGLGQPVFGKLHAALGSAMLSINAVKGFEYGQGFGSMEQKAVNKMTFSTTTKENKFTNKPFGRHSGRNQQRRGYLLPGCLQACGNRTHGATYRRCTRK